MQKGIIGKKIGMTQIFDENGKVVPVTVVEAGPCVVSQKKTVENDGYAAVQIGFGDLKAHKVKKPMAGHFAKANVAPKRTLREFRFDDIDAYNVGDLVKADVFAAGDKVDVTGTSKGKGYAGVIKRWNFQRLKESHGSGPVARHGGSIGSCSDPSRVYPGKKMAPGHPVRAHQKRGFRRRQKALETKRHRPCETGFHPCSPVDSWRYRICSQAEKLPLYRKQEGQKIGSEVCSVL